jgi:hypothetical protein
MKKPAMPGVFKTTLLGALASLCFTGGSTVLFGASVAQAQAQCSTVFFAVSEADQAELTRLEAIYAREPMNIVEKRLFFELRQVHALKLGDFYERYKTFVSWSRVERALSVSNASLVRLAATSLARKTSVEKATLSFDYLILRLRPRNASGVRLRISHGVHARLVETILRGASPSAVSAAFNEHFDALVAGQGPSLNATALLGQTPIELALAQTIADFETTPAN